jgi:hypothetical protein
LGRAEPGILIMSTRRVYPCHLVCKKGKNMTISLFRTYWLVVDSKVGLRVYRIYRVRYSFAKFSKKAIAPPLPKHGKETYEFMVYEQFSIYWSTKSTLKHAWILNRSVASCEKITYYFSLHLVHNNIYIWSGNKLIWYISEYKLIFNSLNWLASFLVHTSYSKGTSMQMQSVAKLCAKSFRHPGIAFYLMKSQGMSSLFCFQG